MKIIIQYFDDEKEADETEWFGDAIAQATSWEEAHDKLKHLKNGYTVPIDKSKTTTLQDLHSKLQGENEQLIKDLRIKAGMIAMGERIAYGSDSGIMEAAADALEKLTTSTINETLAWLREEFGYMNDGCGCCSESKLEDEINTLLETDTN